MYLVFYKIHEDPIIRGDECTVNSTPVRRNPEARPTSTTSLSTPSIDAFSFSWR